MLTHMKISLVIYYRQTRHFYNSPMRQISFLFIHHHWKRIQLYYIFIFYNVIGFNEISLTDKMNIT